MIDFASLQSLAQWWLAIWFCGLLAWPLTGRALRTESDQGYFAAKPLGLLFASYIAWIAGKTGMLPPDTFALPVGINPGNKISGQRSRIGGVVKIRLKITAFRSVNAQPIVGANPNFTIIRIRRHTDHAAMG